MEKDELHPVSFSNPDKTVGRPKKNKGYEALEKYRETVTPEELHARGVLASRNAAVNKRKKKALRELAQFMLDAELLDTDEVKFELEARGFDCTGAGAMLFGQLQKAMLGDTKAAEFIRDTSGQKPTDALAIGNLDDKPFETINFSELTDEQLKQMIAERVDESEN